MNKKIQNKKETIIKENKKGKAKWLEGRLKKILKLSSPSRMLSDIRT